MMSLKLNFKTYLLLTVVLEAFQTRRKATQKSKKAERRSVAFSPTFGLTRGYKVQTRFKRYTN